jgi:ABC-type transporter Mla maintaining outer membrane lipid asymmetry ATPase subunit MlaF
MQPSATETSPQTRLALAGWPVVDWASVVPGAITGVVGIVGIGGSVLSARMAGKSAAQNLQMSIQAEDTRASRAEKRRICASYLASLIEVMAAASTLEIYGEGAG